MAKHIHDLITKGDPNLIEKVDAALKRSEDCDLSYTKRSKDERNLLHTAAEHGNVEMMKSHPMVFLSTAKLFHR